MKTFAALQKSISIASGTKAQKLTRRSVVSRPCIHQARSLLVQQKRFATMATDTNKYKFNHSMIRIKDPQASIKFYEFLGMKVINKISMPDAKFDLYFLAYDGPGAASKGNHWTDREGIVELTHNYGTESDPNFKVANGNSDPGKPEDIFVYYTSDSFKSPLLARKLELKLSWLFKSYRCLTLTLRPRLWSSLRFDRQYSGGMPAIRRRWIQVPEEAY